MRTCTLTSKANLLALAWLTGLGACGSKGPLKGGQDGGADVTVVDARGTDVDVGFDAGPAYDSIDDRPRLCAPPLETVLGNAQPLFVPGDAKNGPIVFKREDGVLVTRGAGRLHTRHEKELRYATYPVGYFEGQSYGFTIEDFTVVGQQRLRVTYLPLYKPGQTMWRAWKSPGNNATFQFNDLAVDVPLAPVAPPVPVFGIQLFDQTMVPADRKMVAGESFEFELGVVQDKGISPFTDTYRYRIGLGGMTPENRDYDERPGPLLGARLGGDTTIPWLFAEPERNFDQPALNLQIENVQDFLEGRRLFNTDFVTGENVEVGNEVFARQTLKAGPRRNTATCATCHVGNGRGAPIVNEMTERSSMVFRVYGVPSVGRQLHPRDGIATTMVSSVKVVQLAGGASVELHVPRYAVGIRGEGGAPPFSARIARPLVGLGLLEAVDERAIASRADRHDCDHDGISGRLSFVRNPATSTVALGRFGWKGETSSVAHQVAEDAVSSMDLGTTLFHDSGGRSLLEDADLAKLTAYVRLLGVPPQRSAEDPQVRAGQQLFTTIGCASCHTPTLETSPNHPLAELRSQTIEPYTDLLLHDLGADLQDQSGVSEGLGDESPPSASEWRTAPLWGVGLRERVNGETGLLHDGRASDVQQAILWHGGEAWSTTARYMALPAAERAALLAFVDSL